MQFPTTSGKNLDRKTITVPTGLEGQFNLVLVAFQRWHQTLIDSWLPAVTELETRYPALRHYELPVLPGMNILSRTFINEGMRAGIPDPVARATTITLYVDKAAYLQALGLEKDDDIHVYLLDRAGAILWRTDGGFSPAAGHALAEALAAITGAS